MAKPQTTDRRPLLRFKDAARYLGCTERWLRRQTVDRTIPHVKLRRSIFFSPDELDAYVEQNRVPVRAPSRRTRTTSTGRK